VALVAAGSWTAARSASILAHLSHPHALHTTTTLPNSRVVILGDDSLSGPNGTLTVPTATVEPLFRDGE
jgi:hypothetical protein